MKYRRFRERRESWGFQAKDQENIGKPINAGETDGTTFLILADATFQFVR